MNNLTDFRLFTLTWPLPFGVRLGWATRVANPDPQTALGRVYFLRGQGVIFSTGFGKLCGQLRQAGVWAEDLRCVGDLWLRRHLRSLHNKGNLQGPIVLVGHSCGGRYALHAAQQLQKFGIAIDLIICVDVAIPFEVPPNVKEAVNLYLTHRRIYPARPLVAGPGSDAKIENIDLNGPGSPIDATGLHHLNITGCVPLQDWLYRRVLETMAVNQR